jgi:hypothetical protein
MSALAKIKNAGFDVVLDGDNFKITPSSQLTITQREFLKAHKAEIVSELKAESLPIPETLIRCGDCLNFKSYNAHGQGSGSCLVGGDYGLWSETLHQCVLFDAVPKHDEWPVNCYTPAGAIIKVWVADIETAIWLKKVNPRLGSGELIPVGKFLSKAINKIEDRCEQNIKNGYKPLPRSD